MTEHEHYENGCGPIYSVPLIDSLPLNPDNPTGMLQQMPSAADLEGIRNYRQGARVCAGYEVLLHHWRQQRSQIIAKNRAIDEFRALNNELYRDLTEAKDEIEQLLGLIHRVIRGDWSVTWLQAAIGDLNQAKEADG